MKIVIVCNENNTIFMKLNKCKYNQKLDIHTLLYIRSILSLNVLNFFTNKMKHIKKILNNEFEITIIIYNSSLGFSCGSSSSSSTDDDDELVVS